MWLGGCQAWTHPPSYGHPVEESGLARTIGPGPRLGQIAAMHPDLIYLDLGACRIGPSVTSYLYDRNWNSSNSFSDVVSVCYRSTLSSSSLLQLGYAKALYVLHRRYLNIKASFFFCHVSEIHEVLRWLTDQANLSQPLPCVSTQTSCGLRKRSPMADLSKFQQLLALLGCFPISMEETNILWVPFHISLHMHCGIFFVQTDAIHS